MYIFSLVIYLFFRFPHFLLYLPNERHNIIMEDPNDNNIQNNTK